MYLIITYDIPEDAVRKKVRTKLRKYLIHQQFSVFEGEITEKDYHELCNALESSVSDSNGGVMIYEFWTEKSFDRKTIGDAEQEESTIL